VQPHVDAVNEKSDDAHVVILDDEHAPAELVAARKLEELADHLLPRAIGGMRLAPEHDLHRPLFVPQNLREPLFVVEQQVRALVRGEASSEAERERALVEELLELAEDVGAFALSRQHLAQTTAQEKEQLELLSLM